MKEKNIFEKKKCFKCGQAAEVKSEIGRISESGRVVSRIIFYCMKHAEEALNQVDGMVNNIIDESSGGFVGTS